jgi:hypothetical protein
MQDNHTVRGLAPGPLWLRWQLTEQCRLLSFSVIVRTKQDVKVTGGKPVKFLAYYGEDCLTVFGSKCRGCTHTRATAQCRLRQTW